MIPTCAVLLTLTLLLLAPMSVEAQMSESPSSPPNSVPPGYPSLEVPPPSPPAAPNDPYRSLPPGSPPSSGRPTNPSTPPPAAGFDINSLTPEQLEQLRRRLALPESPAPTAPSSESSPYHHALPQDILQMIKDSLIIVKGNAGVGSGFLLDMEGETYALTNAHVLDGNRTFSVLRLNNQELGLSGLALADNADIAQLKLRDKINGLPFLKEVDSHVQIGDPVVVMGNSLGANVMTQIVGRITGIGPNLIETDAKFVSGNSGSPIIHVPTRQVIAIATFSMMQRSSSFGSDSQFQGVERRFGYRIDKVMQWQPMTWKQFQDQGNVLRRAKMFVMSCAAIARAPVQDNRLAIATSFLEGSPIGGVTKSYGDKVHPKLSSVQARNETKQFFMTLSNLMEREVQKQNQIAHFHGYFKSEMDDLLQYAELVQAALKNRFNSL